MNRWKTYALSGAVHHGRTLSSDRLLVLGILAELFVDNILEIRGVDDSKDDDDNKQEILAKSRGPTGVEVGGELGEVEKDDQEEEITHDIHSEYERLKMEAMRSSNGVRLINCWSWSWSWS